jgi:release factor glutamine methyltransferase
VRHGGQATIHDRVAAARERLRGAGISPDEADLDARLLAEHLLGWDTARFFASAAETEPSAFAEKYEALVDRRVHREPVAYIVGHHEFWGLDFEVMPGVLIPRPETELIVETALELIAPERFRIADVCTGSGCLAVAVAHENPNVEVTATDTSDQAIQIARRNALRHGVARRITFVRTDLFEGVEGEFDLIVSNPPYVPERERSSLQPEVRDHEPAQALFAGADGLDVIKRLIAESPRRLKPGGSLVFEIGLGQDSAVTQLISATPGIRMIDLRRDLQGIPRTVVARHMA